MLQPVGPNNPSLHLSIQQQRSHMLYRTCTSSKWLKAKLIQRICERPAKLGAKAGANGAAISVALWLI